MLANSFNEYMWAQFLARTFHTSIQTVWAVQTIVGIVIAIVFMIIFFLVNIRKRR